MLSTFDVVTYFAVDVIPIFVIPLFSELLDWFDLSTCATLLVRNYPPHLYSKVGWIFRTNGLDFFGEVFSFMERNPDDINPNWTRSDDWPFPEDFLSVNWKKRVAESDRRVREYREKYGFIYCPICGTGHTCKTVFCRGCEYKVPFTKETEHAT